MTVLETEENAGSASGRSEAAALPHAGCLFPGRESLRGPVTRARQARSVALYACAFVAAAGMMTASPRPELDALALGLMVPGGGFLVWAGPDSPMQMLALGLAAASLVVFLVTLAVWFATGNVLLPIAVWSGAAVAAAAGGGVLWRGEGLWQPATQIVPLAAVSVLGLAYGGGLIAGRRGLRRRARMNAHLRTAEARIVPAHQAADPAGGELGEEDLRLMRLLLDRALQPVEAFEGFEWAGQFQTGAVRYQLNFMSYALSIAQSVHLPAFRGYLHDAQENLIAKQQDHRIWRYWKLENMWGNLCLQADPIARDNIMFSGFLAAQIAYQQGATGGRIFDAPGSLDFRHPSGERYAYSQPALIDVLVRGYRSAGFGLLACEPNWVFPLCNAITASAIRAQDAANGTSCWDEIAGRFRACLEAEFMTAGGRLIPCRSSYTGFAAPQIGGAVMQAFPCLFLNAVLPDIAQRQWMALRHDLAGRDWRRAMWPVDVGNHRFSRASSYAATAAAAVELGDTDTARLLLQRLDDACPLGVSAHVASRPKVSLWSHAVELMARCGRADALRSLVTEPRRLALPGPFIEDAAYPEILVAKAVNSGGALRAVLYPGAEAGHTTLKIGGLAPNQPYIATTDAGKRFQADRAGEARLDLSLDGRTELRITRTA